MLCGFHLPPSRQDIFLSVIGKVASWWAAHSGGLTAGPRLPFLLEWPALRSASRRRPLFVLFFLNYFL